MKCSAGRPSIFSCSVDFSTLTSARCTLRTRFTQLSFYADVQIHDYIHTSHYDFSSNEDND